MASYLQIYLLTQQVFYKIFWDEDDALVCSMTQYGKEDVIYKARSAILDDTAIQVAKQCLVAILEQYMHHVQNPFVDQHSNVPTACSLSVQMSLYSGGSAQSIQRHAKGSPAYIGDQAAPLIELLRYA